MGEVFDNNTNQIFNSIRRAYPQLVDYSNEELLPRLADNEELLNYFISKNEDLIWRVVHQFNVKYQLRNFWRDDSFRQELFQVGLIKLYETIRNYNPELGYRFSTFVYKAVYNSLISYCFGAKNRFRFHEILSLDGEAGPEMGDTSTASEVFTVKHNMGSDLVYQALRVLTKMELAVVCLRMELPASAMDIHCDIAPYMREARDLTKSQRHQIYSKAITKLKTDPRALAMLMDAYEYLVA